ncbi:MAG: caspase family protein [Bacteroidota bacterium]
MRKSLSFCLLLFTFTLLSAQNSTCTSGNCENGIGTYVYRDGSTYSGEWKDGMKHGKGKLEYDSGAYYNGLWKADSKHGMGIYTWPNGNVYRGSFQQNRMSGKGNKTYKSGDKYIGDFLNGKRQGTGTYYWKDGSSYIGEWVNDQRNGFGTFVSSAGTKRSGQWQGGQFIQATVSQNKTQPPSSQSLQKANISWIHPIPASQQVSDSKMELSLCVESDSKVEEVEFYVNGEIQQGNRGFKIVPSDACNYTLQRTLSLSPGKNQIQVYVRNAAGRSASPSKSIYAKISASPKIKEKRTALVIGNGGYNNGPLRNPVNDAEAMAESLRRLNFDVILHTDIGQREMKVAIRDFGRNIKAKGGVGLFYYAGHGMQVNGNNYLIPLNAKIERELDVELESVELYRVMGEMEEADNRMNIVILDACRNNPYTRALRSRTGEGLNITAAPSGTFIAFATAPGSVAADGLGENGLYTQELLNALTVPGLKIEDVFKKVRTQVRIKSNGAQIPWENSSIEGDFYFKSN